VFYQRLASAASAAALIFAAGAAPAQIVPPDPGGAPVETAAPAEAPPPEANAADSPCCTVPARTPIEIELLETVNSKANSPGQTFAFRLAAPLTIEGRVVIPAGTPGVGEVVHAERARFGGRAGELILAARYLDFNGTRIALRTMRFGAQAGRDSSGTINNVNLALAATVPALSLVAFMIAGGEVNVPAGARATAQIAAEIRLAPVE